MTSQVRIGTAFAPRLFAVFALSAALQFLAPSVHAQSVRYHPVWRQRNLPWALWPNYGAAMAWDPDRRQMVLLGGSNPEEGFLSATRVWTALPGN